MQTGLKVPSMGGGEGSLSASSWGAAGAPSKQGRVEACLVWVLSQVREGEGQGTSCPTPAA